MEKVKLGDLSPEQKAALFAEMQETEKAKAERVKQERLAYKEMVDNIVPELVTKLSEYSANGSQIKTEIFDSCKALIELKSEAYDREVDQQTHTFTTSDGVSLSIGYRMNDGWDDTVIVGVQKFNDILASKVEKEGGQFFFELLKKRLEVGKKGLNAKAVLSLKRDIDAYGDADLKDAIEIVLLAYRPVRSKEFVSARRKNEIGEWIDIPVDMSAMTMIQKELADAQP